MSERSKLDPKRYTFKPGDIVEDIDLDEEVVIMDGRRYTEADAERDADRLVEARRRGLRRGGASLSRDGAHSPTVTVTLPRDVRDLVRDRATAEGMSVSKYLRRLIEENVHAA